MADLHDEQDADTERERENLHKELGMRVQRRARRAAPRVPAGTVLLSNHGQSDCLPLSYGSEPSVWQRLAVRQLMDEVVGLVAQGAALEVAIPGETLAALDRAFLAAFGVPPETASWLEPFFSELELGRRAWFTEESDGNEPAAERRLELAQTAIGATRDRLGRTPFVCPLMPRWVTVNLTALLLQKFSFGRGGGPQRALAPATLRELLATPAKLAQYLRKEKIRARLFTRELEELDRSIASDDAPTEK